jgi:hypothetical protein
MVHGTWYGMVWYMVDGTWYGAWLTWLMHMFGTGFGAWYMHGACLVHVLVHG